MLNQHDGRIKVPRQPFEQGFERSRATGRRTDRHQPADIDDADLLPGGAPAPGQQYDDFASDSNAPAGFAPGPASMVSTEFDITPRPLGDEAPF